MTGEREIRKKTTLEENPFVEGSVDGLDLREGTQYLKKGKSGKAKDQERRTEEKRARSTEV